MEPGEHRFVVRPPHASMFPWRIIGGVVAPDVSTSVSMLAPVVWRGIVTIPGVPAGSVTVEAFLASGSGGAILADRAQPDASGAFTLLLPPSPDAP